MKAQFITPVVTAFRQDGTPDHTANREIYDHLISGGITGILLLGSLGEFFNIPLEQQKEMIRVAVQHIGGRVRLIAGTSCMSAKETIALSNFALDQGADSVMVLSPYYFSLSNASIEYFYDMVAEGCKGKIYLYNFPDRTGYSIPPQVVLNLVRKHSNIVGIKDSSGSFSNTRDYITAVLPEFPEFEVFSGFDDNFVHCLASGGAGCIGGLSNLVPEWCGAWVAAAEKEDQADLYKIQKNIDRLMALYSVGKPFIPAVKKAMVLRGILNNDRSSVPFLPSTEEETEQIRTIMRSAGIL